MRLFPLSLRVIVSAGGDEPVCIEAARKNNSSLPFSSQQQRQQMVPAKASFHATCQHWSRRYCGPTHRQRSGDDQILAWLFSKLSCNQSQRDSAPAPLWRISLVRSQVGVVSRGLSQLLHGALSSVKREKNMAPARFEACHCSDELACEI